MARSAPRPTRSKRRTKLAELRIERGLTQAQLAGSVGIPIASYRRLERDEMRDPGIRTLANLAIALHVDLENLIEDHWREWNAFDATGAAQPPVGLPGRSRGET